jgi:3-vinyl bacteriochlorophyllide hydratase
MYQQAERAGPSKSALSCESGTSLAGLAVKGDPRSASNGCGKQLSSGLYEQTAAVAQKTDASGTNDKEPWRLRSISSVKPLYTAEERRRRDASPWTLVQGILAPLQFLVFLISVCLVVRYLMTGDGLAAATASIVVKTCFLYAIMITGSLWEHDVYGRYLFAPAFFWEDVFSMLVLALHAAYLAALATGALGSRDQMYLALAAYATYVINATQFLLKLRAARLGSSETESSATAPTPSFAQ